MGNLNQSENSQEILKGSSQNLFPRIQEIFADKVIGMVDLIGRYIDNSAEPNTSLYPITNQTIQWVKLLLSGIALGAGISTQIVYENPVLFTEEDNFAKLLQILDRNSNIRALGEEYIKLSDGTILQVMITPKLGYILVVQKGKVYQKISHF